MFGIAIEVSNVQVNLHCSHFEPAESAASAKIEDEKAVTHRTMSSTKSFVEKIKNLHA